MIGVGVRDERREQRLVQGGQPGGQCPRVGHEQVGIHEQHPVGGLQQIAVGEDPRLGRGVGMDPEIGHDRRGPFFDEPQQPRR
jgi:hypothetical protein